MRNILSIVSVLSIFLLLVTGVNAAELGALCHVPCQHLCQGKQVRITIPEGTYINSNPDAWLEESSVFYADYAANKWYNFHLSIKNTLSSPVSVSLVVAIPGTTTADDLKSITIDGSDIYPFDSKPFCSSPHGVYPPAGNAIWAFYDVGTIAAGSTKNLTVKVTLGPNPSSSFKVHFDLNGTDDGCNQFHNPYSKDATFTYCENCGDPGVPEFSSIVAPILLSIMSIGLILRRKF